MKPAILIIALVCLTGNSWSQSLQVAQGFFDNFQYEEAFDTYLALNETEDLSEEDQMKLVYSGYVVGEYERTYPTSKVVLNTVEVDPFFYYVHGEISMHLGDYEAAKAAYIKYSQLDDEMDISMKLESCNQIRTWEAMNVLENKELPGNSRSADLTGPTTRFGTVQFHEKSEKDIAGAPQNIEGLALSKPFLVSSEGQIREIKIPEPWHLSSIQSFTFLPNNEGVLFTVSEPLSEDAVKQAPHLYTGSWDAVTEQVGNVRPWQYSGFEDASFCAQATINASGNRIVFAKIKAETSSDLYLTEFNGSSWSTPIPLSAINTNQDEVFPMFQGDSILTFSSEGRPGYGDLDIYAYHFETKEIEHFKAPVNSSKDDFNFVYAKDGLEAMYTSNRSAGTGDDDRYLVKFIPPTVPEVKPDSTDFYAFVENWKDQTIYFKVDRYDLEHDVTLLNALIVFLGKNDNYKIRLDAHTDRRGENQHNYNLSEKRAMTVRDDLVALGIKSDQISINAKGESSPIIDCDTCTEEMHQENRVVIIKLERN